MSQELDDFNRKHGDPNLAALNPEETIAFHYALMDLCKRGVDPIEARDKILNGMGKTIIPWEDPGPYIY